MVGLYTSCGRIVDPISPFSEQGKRHPNKKKRIIIRGGDEQNHEISVDDLRAMLRSIDGKGYKAYKGIEGAYSLDRFTLFFE